MGGFNIPDIDSLAKTSPGRHAVQPRAEVRALSPRLRFVFQDGSTIRLTDVLMTYQLVLLTKSFPHPHARVLSFRVFGPRRRVLGCIYSKRRFYLGIFVYLSLACSAQSTISNDHSVAVLRTDCDTYRNTRGRRSRQAEIDLKDYYRFFLQILS